MDADEPAHCIGTLSRDCMADRDDGETTMGMTECIAGETAAWDGLLNAQYQAVMAMFRMQDASGDVLSADLTREATLRAAQRAWIRFRDADCTMQAARYGQGSLGRVAAANCLMGMTAERAIKLMAMEGP
jgi:uncharacterized protein YecT (DUF1311 family)